jgi:hypothetical protein
VSPVNGRTYAYNQQDQRVYNDGNGIWLQKMLWGSLAPGSFVPLFWWNDALFDFNLMPFVTSFRAFADTIPLNNGRYVDAEPACTGGLRSWGRRMWQPGRPICGLTTRATLEKRCGRRRHSRSYRTVTIGLPDGSYTAEWWDTRTGLVTPALRYRIRAS